MYLLASQPYHLLILMDINISILFTNQCVLLIGAETFSNAYVLGKVPNIYVQMHIGRLSLVVLGYSQPQMQYLCPTIPH